jgi:NAD(P)-dependent dehydrogenase (short-subunit alcohol dehydrogenase family)
VADPASRVVSVVTGAGSGIGRAVAITLAERGDIVVCADIDETAAAETSSAAGTSARSWPVDVAEASSCDDLIRRVITDNGRVDVLVTCAGIEAGGPAEHVTDDVWRRVIEVNLSGTFWCARAAGRAMIERGDGGRIVLIGSVNSRVALPGQVAYCSSKGGVAMLGRALAVDWAGHGITVNTVGPGVVDTPMSAASLREPNRRAMLMAKVPLGRPAAAAEIAAVVAFLASADASYLTGAYIPVDGGWLAG